MIGAMGRSIITSGLLVCLFLTNAIPTWAAVESISKNDILVGKQGGDLLFNLTDDKVDLTL